MNDIIDLKEIGKYSMGIDIGYSSVKVALIDDKDETVFTRYSLHNGQARTILTGMMNELIREFDPKCISFGTITGSGSMFMNALPFVTHVNEVAAAIEGCLRVKRPFGSIVEIGGGSAKYITGIDRDNKARIQVSMNSNCSAGTGSFLEEQISRLQLNLEDYSLLASKAESIPRIAGRCSVFAKTDITHHQQEGVPNEDILLGLAYAVVKNYRGTVMKKLPMVRPIVFIGGVAYNQGIITALKDVLTLEDNGSL